MDQSVTDDHIIALDRALQNGHENTNAKLVTAELARADLTVARLELTHVKSDDIDALFAALEKMDPFRQIRA